MCKSSVRIKLISCVEYMKIKCDDGTDLDKQDGEANPVPRIHGEVSTTVQAPCRERR